MRDPIAHAAWKAERRRHLLAIIAERKDVPCADCGQRYPRLVMEFDHVRGVKCRDVSRMIAHNVSVATLLAEIAKCDVVCANCHRLRTTARGDGGNGAQGTATEADRAEAEGREPRKTGPAGRSLDLGA